MTKRYTLFFFAATLIATSCKRDRKDMLAREWQEVSARNTQFDEVMKSQQQFIDTVGTHTTPEDNLRAYGATNIDSFRQGLQANMDSFRRMQQRSIEQTRFNFRTDGVVIIHTDLGVDSASWKLEEDGTTLVLDEQKLTGAGTQLQMEIIHLSDTSLKLKFNENNTSSTASFVPVKK